MRTINDLRGVVRQTAHAIRVYHGNCHLEKVYENALTHRLPKAGITVQQQHPKKFYDENDTEIGEYFAGLVVGGRLIVELKAAEAIADEHVAQMLGYLKGSHVEHGLLVNFGSYRFEFRQYVFSGGKTTEKQFWKFAVFCG